MMNHMKKLMILATITAILGLASLSQAGVISINFQGERSSVTGPDVTGTAGYIQVGNWNNAAGVSGTVASLNDDSGNNSGASVTWETHNLWDYQSGDGNGGDADMLSGLLDNIGASDTPPEEITISGIPYDAYNVYVYVNRDAARFTGITVSDGSTSKTLYVEHDGTGYDPSEGVNGYTISRDDDVGAHVGLWNDGNVILSPVMTGSTLTIDNAPTPGVPAGGTYQCIINGIQIRGRELTHEIQNGSFEAQSFTASDQGGSSEIGTFKYVEESNIGTGEWGYTQPIDWLHPGWGTHVHMITDTGGTAAFPDGDFAMQLYDLGQQAGVVLEQEGIYLTAGKLYEFSLDAWSGTEEAGDAFITVDLVGSGTTKVMDNLTVDKDNSAYETMSAQFTAPTTEAYTLRIYSESAGGAPQSDLFFDNLQIEWLPAGTLIFVQ